MAKYLYYFNRIPTTNNSNYLFITLRKIKSYITIIFIPAFVFLLIFISCENTNKITRKIIAKVETDTTQNVPASDNSEEVKQLENLKIEFADLLLTAPDSIEDVKLYQFIKNNLDKKCFGIKNPEFACESFLTLLLKSVYSIDVPNNIEGQMKSKNISLFKDENYLAKGDLLFFNYSAKQLDKISHVGFYLQNGFMVIATYNEGVVITRYKNGYWDKRFTAAGRIIK